MSFVFDAYQTYGTVLDDVTAGLYTQLYVKRQIGGIFPDVVTEELHRDTLQTTKQPIETGAPITDHAFMMQPLVEIRGGFSNSSAGSVGWAQAAYQMLMALQQAREVFDISTGKRYYSNMLMTNLMVMTSSESENTLMFTASCEGQIFVSTQSSGAAQTAGTTNGSTPIGAGAGNVQESPTGTSVGSTPIGGGAGNVQEAFPNDTQNTSPAQLGPPINFPGQP